MTGIHSVGTDAAMRRSPRHVWRQDTGMVTIEFAVMAVTSALVLACVLWLVMLLGWQLRVHDIAWESARQMARGASWSSITQGFAARDATVTLSITRTDTLVTVGAARVLRSPGFLPDMTVDAHVTAMVEP